MTDRQCGTPWGVCSACLGVGLTSSGAEARCPRCLTRYSQEALEGPCRQRVAFILRDSQGVEAPVCASHAAHPSVAGLQRRPYPYFSRVR